MELAVASKVGNSSSTSLTLGKRDARLDASFKESNTSSKSDIFDFNKPKPEIVDSISASRVFKRCVLGARSACNS